VDLSRRNLPEHDPFPLNLRVENARPLGERNKLIHGMFQHQPAKLRARFQVQTG
jgi:hypothetical protein